MPIERQKIKRGDVYIGDPEPVVGHEQGGRRPFLIVSIEQMNRSPARVAIAVPLTTTDRRNKLHVRVEPPEGGLERVSFAMPEMVRSISSLRLQRRLGRASMDTVESVANRIGLLVGLGRSH
ncbi:MAG TPA: type II toxin-antitoxin system PemK/MazF family toxin [Solirubrobacterales bacterium]|nr:type II toxin-antitoxin system PemK/MazF family toxin [Solirubrobacterales bacterium]